MVWDKKGRCWIASVNRNGIYQFDTKTASLTYVEDQSESTIDFGEKVVYVDSEGWIWFGFYGRGLALFDPEDETFNYFPDRADGSGTKGRFIQSILRITSYNVCYTKLLRNGGQLVDLYLLTCWRVYAFGS